MIPGPPRHRSRLDLIGDTIEDGMDPDPRDAHWMYQRLRMVEKLMRSYERVAIVQGRTLLASQVVINLRAHLFESDDGDE